MEADEVEALTVAGHATASRRRQGEAVAAMIPATAVAAAAAGRCEWRNAIWKSTSF